MVERNGQTRVMPGVLFIEDFDEVQDCPPPVMTVEDHAARAAEPMIDVEEEKRVAYEEGLAAGHRLAEEGMTARRCSLLSRIESLLEASCATMHDGIERHLDLIAGTALQVISDCLPAFCEHNGAEEIRALLRSTLAAHAQEPVLVVAVNPAFEELAKQEAARLSGRSGCVSIVPDPDIQLGDATVSWQTGVVRRDTSRLRGRLLDRLIEVGLLPESERSSS